MAESIILYTLPECDVSDRARDEMTAEGIAFEERNVMRNKAWFDEAMAISIFVPIIVRDGVPEIGWKGQVG